MALDSSLYLTQETGYQILDWRRVATTRPSYAVVGSKVLRFLSAIFEVRLFLFLGGFRKVRRRLFDVFLHLRLRDWIQVLARGRTGRIRRTGRIGRTEFCFHDDFFGWVCPVCRPANKKSSARARVRESWQRVGDLCYHSRRTTVLADSNLL